MTEMGFAEFRAAALADTDLQAELRGIDARAEFVLKVVDTASELGFDVKADDVENAINTGRRAWIERWI